MPAVGLELDERDPRMLSGGEGEAAKTRAVAAMAILKLRMAGLPFSPLASER